MLKDLVNFILLYAIIFWIFLCIALLAFGDQEAFQTMYKAARSMFEISMQGTTFSDFDQITFVDARFGTVILLIFIVVSNITLLNFVIAILSNTYALLTNISSAVYLK